MSNAEQLLADLVETLAADDRIGILLMAQMGSTPQELQLVIQTADYDEEQETITTDDTYLLRGVGVQEHRLSLGLFNRMVVVDEHPMLWNHNFPYQGVYFRGGTDNVDGLMLELNQLYGQYYGIFRSLADDVNRMAPLGSILSGGYGMLGEMPEPMAAQVEQLLTRYGYQVTRLPAEREVAPYACRLLVIDDSYVVAQMLGADPIQAGG